jgi:hypothetical protein
MEITTSITWIVMILIATLWQHCGILYVLLVGEFRSLLSHFLPHNLKHADATVSSALAATNKSYLILKEHTQIILNIFLARTPWTCTNAADRNTGPGGRWANWDTGTGDAGGSGWKRVVLDLVVEQWAGWGRVGLMMMLVL